VEGPVDSEKEHKPVAFEAFQVDLRNLPRGISAVGNGSVGGKAKGLIMVASAMEARGGKLVAWPDEPILIPETVILTTEIYDRFMDQNGLHLKYQRYSYEELQRAFLAKEFPAEYRPFLEEILRRWKGPLAVRSSSLMEDSIHYAFAGIYLTLFIANRGTPEERVQQLERAIKLIFASTFNPDALEYRRRHNLSLTEEKMAVVIQPVVGKPDDGYFYPLLAGVAFSRNFYPWSDRIRMEDGVVRVVFGLGTRAVGRNYARVFSLTNPRLRPEGTVVRDILRYSQEVFDALDLEANELKSLPFKVVKCRNPEVPLVTSVLKDGSYFMEAPFVPRPEDHLVLTFNPLIHSDRHMKLVPLLRAVLRELEDLFGVPVDIEFAVDFEKAPDGTKRGRFYLLQCRPFGGREEHQRVHLPQVPPERLVLKGRRTMGNGLKYHIPYLIYVDPERYLEMPPFQVAREIGRLNHKLGTKPYILIGPGRWGSNNPQLGVPVTYADISQAEVIVEVAVGRFSPELSYGTHFFGDMLADGIYYIPIFPEKGDPFNKKWLDEQTNHWSSPYVKLIALDEGFNTVVDGFLHEGMVYF